MALQLEPSLLSTRWAGRGAVFYERVSVSTNATVKAALLESALPVGSLALCERQTGGRGRMQRSWEAEEGTALLMSLLLRPTLAPEQLPLCMLMAAVAVARAVEDVAPGLAPGIKWPNDVVLNGLKCAGILSELTHDLHGDRCVVLGVGVNLNQTVFPPELVSRATSLYLTSGAPVDRDAFLRALLSRMEEASDALERDGFAGFRGEYERRSVTLRRRVEVLGADARFLGMAERVDDEGALWVRDESDALHRVLSADVSVRGANGYA